MGGIDNYRSATNKVLSRMGSAIGIARVLASSLGEKNGTVLYNLAGVGRDDDPEEIFTEARPLQQSYSSLGAIGRPPSKDEDGDILEALFVRAGDESIPFSYRDPRILKWINKGSTSPALPREGEMLYAGWGGAFVSFMRRLTSNGPEDDVTIRVPYARNGAGVPTTSHVIFVGKEANGTPLIDIRSGTGLAITMRDGVGTITSPDGKNRVTVSNGGVGIDGSLKAFGGAEIGGVGALPLAKHGSFLTALQALQGCIVAINGAATTPATAGIATALAALLTPLQTAIAACVAPATGPTTFLKGM